MNSAMPAVVVSGFEVSKSYDPRTDRIVAVKDATFSVTRGARIAVLGPSGSGKTTLLHLMGGVDTPTSGVVEWPSLAGGSLRPQHLNICFQSPSLLQALSILENVMFPLLLGDVGELAARATAEKTLDRLGLADLADRLPEEISGGQSQRVALARALVTRPALLLADEPTGQQDLSHRARMMEVLLDLAVEGETAIVIATHDPTVAALCDTNWTMQDGRLSAEEA
jgi:ABC-type lipoprotein export system ATPase subunit